MRFLHSFKSNNIDEGDERVKISTPEIAREEESDAPFPPVETAGSNEKKRKHRSNKKKIISVSQERVSCMCSEDGI